MSSVEFHGTCIGPIAGDLVPNRRVEIKKKKKKKKDNFKFDYKNLKTNLRKVRILNGLISDHHCLFYNYLQVGVKTSA